MVVNNRKKILELLMKSLVVFSCTAGIFGQQYENVPEGAASLAFVFDITGSMYDDLVQVIEGAAKILATTLSRREKPLYNYVLVPFHDPDVGPVVVTTDPEDFQHELRNMYVQGGGDCPEMSISAIKEAIDVSLPNSFIYVFTDARSKDFYLTEEVLAMIQKKQSQVVFVLTGDCDDPEHEGYLAYEQIASTSSGQVFLLKKSQVNEVLNFVRVAVQSRKVNLMSVDVQEATVKENSYTVPIDSRLQEITISVSGQKPKISLITPSGNKLTPRRGLVKLLDIRNALVVNVKNPQPGIWNLGVESEGRHTIRVTGLSTTDFVAGFSRKPVNDMKDTEHRPIGGIPTFLMINATDFDPPGGFSQVELFDLYGKRLAEYPLKMDELRPSLYTVPSFVAPDVFFYIKVSGIDNQGFKIHRQTPTAVTRIIPGLPEPRMDEITKGYFGLTAVIVCRVNSLVPYTVRFFKEEVQQGPEMFFMEPADVTLEIPGANQFAEGIYFCNATNVAGSRRIPTFLDVTDPPPSITVPQNVSVLSRESALMTCNVFSAEEYNLTWHRSGFRDRLRTSQKFVDFNNGSLLIRNVGREDEGIYSCKASNEGGTTEKTVFLRVQAPPLAKVLPKEASFILGDTTELVCTAEGFPDPSINWLRGGLLMVASDKVRITSDRLVLHNMVRGDEGEYTCLATNPAGKNSVDAILKYIEPPHITVYESKVLVAGGDEAILFCGADGIPKPKIHWYKGAVELKALSYVQISDSGQLRIIGAQALDAGEYRCEAVNEAGNDSAKLILEVGSVPQITEQPENQGVDIGGNVTLTCKADGLPKPQLFWKRTDGRSLDFGQHVKLLPSGSLFLQEVIPTDEGSYVCVAQNRFGTNEASAYLTVTGIVLPHINYMDPVIQAKEGETVELNCQVSQGKPTPRVQWLHKGQSIQTDQYVNKNKDGVVIIENVQSFHADDYLCLASNVGGNASFIVSLHVQVPPTFVSTSFEDEQIDFNVLQGSRVILPCNVKGEPLPIISWFKDGSPISLTDYHYYIGEDGSLEIYSAEAVDSGIYRCEAKNMGGEIEKTVTLLVQVPPTIEGDPNEKYTIIENQTVVLPCSVSGVPPPEVTWRKNFVQFKPDSAQFSFSDHGMTISGVKVNDKGIYECIASNVAGDETKVFVLIVQVPPVILYKGQTEFTVRRDEEVTLDCNNTGDPIPSVEWKKDEKTLSIFDPTNGFAVLESGSLLIESAQVEHTGRYVCIVTNEAGVATKDFVVHVQESPSLPENLTTYKEVIENNPTIILCPAAGTPTPIITWYKNGELITGENQDVDILEDGSLQILSASSADTATYKCVAENEAGQVEHEVDIKVLVPPRIIGTDSGKTSVDNPKVIVGNNVTLTCPVVGIPLPGITWLKNGFELTDAKVTISDDGKHLTITSADVSDTARYTCIAQNVAGKAEKSFDLDVHVPPLIDDGSVSPSNNTVVKDNTLYLDCPVSGIPRPKVLWYKDGSLLSPEVDPNLRIHADGRRLEILEARVTDTGQYKCVGENVAGSTEQTFDVDVQVPPKTDNPGEINRPEIVTNGSISLTCPAAGRPRPQITWYKNNQPVNTNTSQYVISNDGWTLEIIKANVDDSARYTCRAKNPAGETEKAFDLHVLVPPLIDRVSIVLNPKVVINQSTIINCPVSGDPSPSIIWYKNGILIDVNVQPRYEILSGGRQLRVKNAQLVDTATFQCFAENKAGTDSVDFNLRVLVPSKIDIRHINTNPKVVVNGSLSILCPATGVPLPQITWFKDGKTLLDDEQEFIQISNGGQELNILFAQVQDTGRYTCRATNEAGDVDIGYNVEVHVPPSINQDEVNSMPSVILGNSIALNCPATGTPKPSIIWLKDGQPIDLSGQQHYTVEADGQRLLIENAQIADAKMYTCLAANEAGSVEQNFKLSVWVAPKIDSRNLNLDATIVKGHNAVLFCPVNGNPTPDIIWLKNNEPLPLDDRVHMALDGRELKIDNAMENDTSTYTCVARNIAGQDSLTYKLKVHVPPSIDESNVVYFRKVVENRTIIIECPVSGIPTPEVSWLINSVPVTLRSGLKLSHNSYHLELASAQVSDSAVYTCVATNAAGQLTKKFDLEVQVPPVINKTRLETDLIVIQNRSRAILCPVTGIPRPSIIWLKGGVPLLDWPYPDMALSNQEQRLEVINAQTDDGGLYTCQATNPAGQTKLDFMLQVYVPPIISNSQIVSVISVIQGAAVALDCVSSGTPDPQLAWIKDGDVIEIAENPHIRIQNNGQLLQITNLVVKDTGRYVCHAENKAGIAEKLYDLEVYVPPKIEGTKGFQKVWVIINEPLTLECPADGVPPPEITWIRQERLIQQYSSPGISVLDDGKKLYISSAQLLDEGEYQCYVENIAGNASLEYTVKVYMPAKIEDGPAQIQAVVNTGVTLLCESDGIPDPVIKWQKDGNNFPTTGLRHRMRVSGTLEFISVRLEDAGTYTCKASNEAGNALREMQLDVQVPPRILGRQPLYLDSVEGGRVVLPCDVTGVPTPRIVWQKGTKVIRATAGIEILENGSLYLQQTKETDAGAYICVAQNSAGTAFGQIRLRIFIPPNIQTREKEFVINSAQNIVLPCHATGQPRPIITWKKDGVEITSGNAYVRIGRNALAIPFTRSEDAGRYTCVATNTAGSHSVDINLVVQVPPQIAEASRLLTFTVGEDADISCAAIGIPPPTVTWLKEGQLIDANSAKYEIMEFGNLIIHSLTKADTGSYMCSASNVAGQATQERLLRIQVPPSFIIVPQVQEVLLNARLELRCTADGIPTPTVHWKRNDVPIQSSSSVNGRSVHIVYSVKPEDAGVYTCLAQNPAGQAEVNTMVTVKVPPEILTPPGNKAVTVAERVVLPCSVGGDPPPEVTWMKNGRPVQLSDRIKKLANGSLLIFDSTSSDAGEYKCVAINDAGSSEGVAMLTVREPPIFVIEPHNTIVEQGENIHLDCTGTGEPVPKMEWMIGWDVLQDKGRLSVLPNNTLRIVAVQLSDSGTYRCLASNNLGKTFVEVNITVVVHGQWSDWSRWEGCSTTCGEGKQLRHRLCNNPEPANLGRECVGSSVESKMCMLRQCPVPGNWGNWLPWEACSVTCDTGEHVRHRSCDNPAPQFGGEKCVGSAVQAERCNQGSCSVDGGWGVWSHWQPCSLTCGNGIQERSRACDSPAPSNRGRYCQGSDVERQSCKQMECPVDGMWGHWEHWGMCTLSCGGGSRTRQRMCNNPAPEYGGLFCTDTDTQLDYCNNEPCPVHGGWSVWGEFGECSVSCNGGQHRRYRSCSNPQPSNNGRPCAGPSDDTEKCNNITCPVDGAWSDWSSWTACSSTCDKGTKQRERSCRQPRHGGLACRGDRMQVMDCNLRPCYTVPIMAVGNIVGYVNNIDIPGATFTADMIPLPDSSATHVSASIKNVPSILAPHFRHLLSVLGPVYWTTSMEIDGAANGYTLTKGDFTQEVQVQYTTGEILKMSHYSKGINADGQLELDIVLRGYVPDLTDSKEIKLAPYWEQYTQTGPGSVHADSRRLFHVDGFMLPYAWNHSITYKSEADNMPYLVQRLYARNFEVNVQPEAELVTFSLDTSITPGSPSNQCPLGYILNPQGPFCDDVDECTRQKPCSDFCHNSPGSYSCSCPLGFALDIDGRQCLDIDECTTASERCSAGQECTNTIGSYRCHASCGNGFKPSEDGSSCFDIDECVETPGVCEQICINRNGSYKCSCSSGYRRASRGRCIDIDECELKNPPCEQVCANAPGSYLCSCRLGFQLVSNGRCDDINECRAGIASCGPDQDCVNTIGNYSCVTQCQKGYELVNGKCTDVDECTTGKHRCYFNQRCINTDPGYKCVCPRGYRSVGPGTPCLDIDECSETKDICSYQCQNTHGGYECICAPGQVRLADRRSCAGLEFLEPAKVLEVDNRLELIDRFSRQQRSVWSCPLGWLFSQEVGNCIDIDECVEDPGVCQHNCTNTVGSYQCFCPPGYRVSKEGSTCDDIDECIESKINCGKDKMCFNTLGEFTCIDIPCPRGYQREPITNNCVLECINAEIACPESAPYADVIEFRALALPSGVLAQQDLIRLIAYNQNNEILRKTTFTILENDRNVLFEIRLEDGIGIMYTPKPLQDSNLYRIKVQAKSYDNLKLNIQYQTTFMIHISVSAYPY